ncbi:MAG: hypothetical protein ABIR35_08970, partial [Polaromonas sp.]
MKSPVRPEFPTAAMRSSQATLAAVDNSASFLNHPKSTYKSTGTSHVVKYRSRLFFSLVTVFLRWREKKLRLHEEQTAHLQTVLLHWFFSADLDTNRSAGLHSGIVVTSIG